MDGYCNWNYTFVAKKIKPQLQRCRNKDIRMRAEFLLYGLKIGDVQLAAKRLGFGRTTYYKWKKRLIAGRFKLSALIERSRRPITSPKKISVWLESKIRFYRRKGYGAMMTRELLKRDGLGEVSISTIQHVFNKRQKNTAKKPRKQKLKKHRKRYELTIPGQRLQLDVKYVPAKVGGKRIFSYVAIDECTRWRFAYAYEELNAHWTIDFLNKLVKACPFPIHEIQTDNGTEFTYRLLLFGNPRHPMEDWCKNSGIKHRLIPPGLKELNGKVERSHRIDAEYFYGSAPEDNIIHFNRALLRWIKRYNSVRPHHGINFMTPHEKLAERHEFLRHATLSWQLEPIRRKFLNSKPIITYDIDWQLEELERELLKYNLRLVS